MQPSSVNCFKKLKIISRPRNLWTTPSANIHIYIEVLFSNINQIRAKKKAKYVPVRGSIVTGDTKRCLLSPQQKQMSYMRVANTETRESNLLVWLNNEMEGGQSSLAKPDAIYFRESIPLMLPELKYIVIQTRFEVRKGDGFIWDVAIKGIISSRICCRISSNANMAVPHGLTVSAIYQWIFIKTCYHTLHYAML